MTIAAYIDRQPDPEVKVRLRRQAELAASQPQAVPCLDCGFYRSLLDLYRCLYCGGWYCVDCAQEHFGKTIEQWTREKWAEQKAEFERTLTSGPAGPTRGAGPTDQIENAS